MKCHLLAQIYARISKLRLFYICNESVDDLQDKDSEDEINISKIDNRRTV